MKEKTKQILRYVACGLGGLALGIGLLGGLSMCATSGNKTTESVNTILAKTPKGEQITTTEGGYTGYKMSFRGAWGLTNPNNQARTQVYSIDTTTWTPTLIYLDGMVSTTNYWNNNGVYTWQTFVDAVNQRYEQAKSSTTNEVRLMHTWASVDLNGMGIINAYMEYWSFVAPSQIMRGLSFVYVTPSWTTYEGSKLDDNQIAFRSTDNQPLILSYAKTNYFLIDTTRSYQPQGEYYFQDIESYYKEQGYQGGHDAGYAEGSQDGYDDGYAQGYTDGSDNSLLFTKIGANQIAWSLSDISWDDGTDTTSTMKCLDFKDGENNTYYVNLVDYTSGGGEVQVNVYKNGTASNNFYGTIGKGNYNRAYTEIDIIPSSYLEFDFAQVITYYHNAIPNNWFMLSGTPANANGYQQGYQAGYRDGQMSTPSGQATDNVFSLFTSAFDSIGGIFEMKIFGFLPLYWFFLTPIFIAIITLLLRMVKH